VSFFNCSFSMVAIKFMAGNGGPEILPGLAADASVKFSIQSPGVRDYGLSRLRMAFWVCSRFSAC
jgi:hypothetical protein